MRPTSHFAAGALASCVLFLNGCQDSSTSDEYTDYAKAQVNQPAGGSEHHHAHGADETGPHGGHVVAFAEDHSAHAEVTFDNETRTIMVYFFGHDFDEPMAVDIAEFEFELESGDDELELDATPKPGDGEAEGKSSAFEIAGSLVPESIDDIESLHAHFHVTIDGNEFTGRLTHDHDDHDDHDDHEDHEEHHEGGDDHDKDAD